MSITNVLLLILLGIALPLAYIGLRYVRIKFGFKDNNNSGVQRISRKSPPKRVDDMFLPGSRAEEDSSLEALKRTLRQNQPVKKTSSRQEPLFTSKKDIKRAYIIDAILDKPRWKDDDMDIEDDQKEG